MKRRDFLGGVGSLAALLAGCVGQMGGYMAVIVENRTNSTISGHIIIKGPNQNEEPVPLDLDRKERKRYDELIHEPDYTVEYEMIVELDNGIRATQQIHPSEEGKVLVDIFEDEIVIDVEFPD